MARIFPSLISADLLNLEKQLRLLDPHCSGYHLDVMDYHFVSNLTWGPSFIHAIAQKTDRQLWVHLMVDNPQTWVDTLTLPPTSILTFHLETVKDPLKIARAIQEKNWIPSIAINPETNLARIFPLTNTIPHILIMSVKPGRSGQQFIAQMADKAQELARYRATHNLSYTIAMDGGISAENIGQLARVGVDDFAVAQAIFGQADPIQALHDLTQKMG